MCARRWKVLKIFGLGCGQQQNQIKPGQQVSSMGGDWVRIACWVDTCQFQGSQQKQMFWIQSFYFLIFLLFKYSCLHFPSTTFPCPTHPTFYPQSFPPLALSMSPLYMFLDDPSPFFPRYCPPPSPLVTVSLFFISVSVVLFCLSLLYIRTAEMRNPFQRGAPNTQRQAVSNKCGTRADIRAWQEKIIFLDKDPL